MTTDVPKSLVNGGIILRRQTTFWELASTSDPVEVWRVHFFHKAEFRFVQTTFDRLAVVDRHAVLLDHQEPWDRLFISSRTADPDGVLQELKVLADRFFQGWRSITCYLNAQYPAARLLSDGSGMLLQGPRSFVDACKAVITDKGIRIDTPGGRSAGDKSMPVVRALLCGVNYIVAQRFDFEPTAR